MKKVIALVLVVAAAAAVYRFAWATPQRRACAHMAELCGGADRKEVASCQQDLDDLRKAVGGETVDKPIQCIIESKSCFEAIGCTAGAYGKGAIKATGEMLKGLGKALSE